MNEIGDLDRSELEALLQRLQSVSRHLVAMTASALAGFDQRNRTRVTLPEYRVLVLLASGRTQTPSELAGELEISRPAVTQIVGRLEAARLVRRRQSRNDRRSFRLTPTARGARVVETVVKQRERRLRSLLANLSHQEQRKLLRALERLDRTFEASRDSSIGANEAAR